MVNFFVKFLSEPTVVLGLVAMIGLIAMKNRPSTVIQGTMKTMLGFDQADHHLSKIERRIKFDRICADTV